MKQMDGDQSPEAVKPGTTTLPALKAIIPRTSPIDVQDWLELVAAPMSDLSNTSATWWAKVRELASMTYKRWTQASPIERLNIQPPFSKELEEGRYARVNARAASMIMLALDSAVSGEIVARRLTQSTPALLFRILTLYQPGGEYEKGWVLKQLQSPEPASDAVKALRFWSRWSRRSEDLGLARLARGLTSIVQPVLERDYEANFRTLLIRNSLKIDTAPTNESVADYLHHLLAEMEGLSTASGGAAPSALGPSPVPPVPKMKELRAPPKSSSPTRCLPNKTAWTRHRSEPAFSADTSGSPPRVARVASSAPTCTRGMDWRRQRDAWYAEEKDTWPRSVRQKSLSNQRRDCLLHQHQQLRLHQRQHPQGRSGLTKARMMCMSQSKSPLHQHPLPLPRS